MKYKLTKNSKTVNGVVLYQIQALKDFGAVKSGDLGGWIEKEANLSQEGNCWVFGNAQVYGYSFVSGNAQVYGHAQVTGAADVFGDAKVCGYAEVYGHARVYGYARVYGNINISQ